MDSRGNGRRESKQPYQKLGNDHNNAMLKSDFERRSQVEQFFKNYYETSFKINQFTQIIYSSDHITPSRFILFFINERFVFFSHDLQFVEINNVL